MPRELQSCKAVVRPLAQSMLIFLHFFCGKEDRLGDAVQREAEAAGLRVRVEAHDLARGQDLAAPGALPNMIERARRGESAAAHSGFPCTTFTQLRWRYAEGMPGPVRSRLHVYGLPSNSQSQQAKADRGTLFASQSVEVMEAMEQAPATLHPKPNKLSWRAAHAPIRAQKVQYPKMTERTSSHLRDPIFI